MAWSNSAVYVLRVDWVQVGVLGPGGFAVALVSFLLSISGGSHVFPV